MVQGAKRVVCASSWSKAIRAVVKQRFVDHLQNFAQCLLYELILETGNPNRTRLPLVFWNVYTSDRLMAVTSRHQPFVQIPDVSIQGLPVLIFGDTVHSHRCVFTLAMKSPREHLLVEEMRQREKSCARVPLSSLHYLQQFW